MQRTGHIHCFKSQHEHEQENCIYYNYVCRKLIVANNHICNLSLLASLRLFNCCQAQFQLPSSGQVQLRNEISLIIIVRPPHPTRASIFEPLLDYLGG